MRDISINNKASIYCRTATWLLTFCLASGFSGGALLLSSGPAFADGDPGARKRASRRVTPTKRRGQKESISYWDADFTVALKSDYIFRGWSQNDQRITPQLEFAMNFTNGAHFTFAASVLEEQYFDAEGEIEYEMGYTHNVNKEIDLDYGLRYFYYPGSDLDSGYAEVYFTLMHQAKPDHGVNVGLIYANDYHVQTDEYWRAWAGYRYEWKGLDVWVNLGWNYFDDPNGYLKFAYGADEFIAYNQAIAAGTTPLVGSSLLISQDTDDSYADVSIGVSHQFNDFLTLALEFTDTDLSSRACSERCSDHTVVSLYWQF